MKNQVLVKRYSLGLIHALRGEAEFQALIDEMGAFLELLRERPRLHSLFTRPFLPTSRKKILAERLLEKAGASGTFTRFVLLLIEKERLEFLEDMLAALPDIWNREKGVATFEVFSVISLSGDQKKNLRQRLEKLESGPVALKFKTDPALIGGLRLRKGNIVYDASLQGDLERLQNHIIEG
jgi:F-type H+-transporting ATPase subunit delta